jgi:hypothetical protein
MWVNASFNFKSKGKIAKSKKVGVNCRDMHDNRIQVKEME